VYLVNNANDVQKIVQQLQEELYINDNAHHNVLESKARAMFLSRYRLPLTQSITTIPTHRS